MGSVRVLVMRVVRAEGLGGRAEGDSADPLPLVPSACKPADGARSIPNLRRGSEAANQTLVCACSTECNNSGTGDYEPHGHTCAHPVPPNNSIDRPIRTPTTPPAIPASVSGATS
jgi:hypothetical protein